MSADAIAAGLAARVRQEGRDHDELRELLLERTDVPMHGSDLHSALAWARERAGLRDTVGRSPFGDLVAADRGVEVPDVLEGVARDLRYQARAVDADDEILLSDALLAAANRIEACAELVRLEMSAWRHVVAYAGEAREAEEAAE